MTSQKSIIMIIVLAVLGTLIFHFLGANFPSFVGFLVGVVSTVIVFCLSSSVPSSNKTAPATPGSQTLYVGNLPYKANESHVRELFSKYGEVVNVRLMKDKRTGKRRGFGFVIVAEQDTKKVIKNLNNYEYMQRELKVRIANDPKHPEEETSAPA